MSKKLQEMTNEELWELFPILLCEYNEDWLLLYAKEARMIGDVIPKDRIVRITHIGSTAVKGLVAKPTIDILLEVAALNDEGERQDLIRRLEQTGYIYSHQPGKPAPHMMFMKGYTEQGFKGQAFHLHVRYCGDWDEIHFCRYLRDHPEAADAYGALKRSLLPKFAHDRNGYTAAKTAFVEKYTLLARQELVHSAASK